MNYGVYFVTQGDLAGDRTTADVVEAAVAGGVDVVQVREKHATAREQYEVGRSVRAVTREAGVPLIVNDRVDVARAVDADGVHLGDDDLPVEVARDQLGPDAVVGRSVSTVGGAREAERAGADYLGVGALYRTATKETSEAETAIGLSRLSEIRAAVDLPAVGIGGVTAEEAADVVAGGADGVAVVSEIAAAADPERATRELVAAVEAGRDRRGERA